MRRPDGYWKCSKKCELCEGKGMLVVGEEGFVNRHLEQDVRDIYESCENATFIERDYPDRRED